MRSSPPILLVALFLSCVTACGGSADTGSTDGGATDALGSEDGGSDATHGGDDTTDACTSATIAFDLTIDSTDPVFLGGSQPPWPASEGCPGWLTITSADTPLVVSKGDCFIGCAAARPQPAAPQSFTWDGTYYPIPADATVGSATCTTPACAVPGNYVATFCAGYAVPDAGLPATSPPTCKQIPFTWPPPAAASTITETITPTPDGG